MSESPQDKENQGSKTEQTNVLSKDVISNGIHGRDPIESWKRTLQIELSADKNIVASLTQSLLSTCCYLSLSSETDKELNFKFNFHSGKFKYLLI